MKNLLIAQSGGPTAAINATLAGIFQAAQTHSEVDKIYGARNGIQGVFEERFTDLGEWIKDTGDIELLCQTPSAVLGSCRFKLKTADCNEQQYKEIFRVFYKYDIKYFIYIGGNDSMDTVWKLSQYGRKEGRTDISIMGAPKTIDNDLAETDHSPGFGSAAKYIATTFAELERDAGVYLTDSVLIVETMGRDSGWLTAASALAGLNGAKGPDLIYLCERIFDPEQFIKDVKRKLRTKNSVIVAVSEGIRNKEGIYISEKEPAGQTDDFGHKYMSGAGRVLEDLVRRQIGCKVRSVQLNLMQRSASHIASAADINESRMLGMKAFQCAAEGISGQMASIRRKSSKPYEIEFVSVPIEKVANQEKKVPLNFITESGNHVTGEVFKYMTPLIQGEIKNCFENGIPRHFIII